MDRRERLDDPTESLRTALDGKQAEIWTALPGIIQNYNPQAMTVSVQPAIQGARTDESGVPHSESLPLLIDVPVCFPNGGGFSLTFPIAAGDECLVVFAARCIDGWWQSGGVQGQAEARMHDLSDGFCIPGPRSQTRTLSPAADAQNVQLRSDDGENNITITPDGIITHEAKLRIEMKAPQIVLQGALSIVGADGSKTTATLEGTMIATEDVFAGGKSGAHHNHPGVHGPTGEPQ